MRFIARAEITGYINLHYRIHAEVLSLIVKLTIKFTRANVARFGGKPPNKNTSPAGGMPFSLGPVGAVSFIFFTILYNFSA